MTGRPVFFAGVGEKPEDLEEFHPDRMAGRIMGMGDVLSLIDKASEKLDAEEAKASAEKMLGGAFTLEDFLAQLRQMRSLGPIQDLLKMLPGMPGGKNAFKEIADQVDEGKLRQAEALILSMTPRSGGNPLSSPGPAACGSPAERAPPPPTSTRSSRTSRVRGR